MDRLVDGGSSSESIEPLACIERFEMTNRALVSGVASAYSIRSIGEFREALVGVDQQEVAALASVEPLLRECLFGGSGNELLVRVAVTSLAAIVGEIETQSNAIRPGSVTIDFNDGLVDEAVADLMGDPHQATQRTRGLLLIYTGAYQILVSHLQHAPAAVNSERRRAIRNESFKLGAALLTGVFIGKVLSDRRTT